jgi:outer membrane protein OmpA-like peptidoglycan-associated protein
VHSRFCHHIFIHSIEAFVSKRNKYTLIATCILATLLLFSATILPMIVRSKAVAAIEEATGRKAHIQSVSINPLTLTVAVKGFAIDEKEGTPLVGFSQVRASLALASIYKRALILSYVTIDTPAFSFARTGPNRFSFSDILDRQKKTPTQDKKGEFLFSINNISVTNGSLDFDDRAVPGGRKHTIRALNIAIPFISNIPYLAEKYTDPRISAVVNGAPFSFAGKLKPLSKSLETSVRVDLKQLSLPEYVAYSPVPPPADLVSGTLTVDMDVNYRISADRKPELTAKGVIRLDGIGVNMKNGQPLAKLPSLEVKASRLEVFARLFEFEAITIDGLEMYVNRDSKGEWMYSRLLPPAKADVKPEDSSAQKSEAGKDEKQPVIQVSSLAFKNGTVHFSDALPKGGFKTALSEIDFTVKNFSTAPGKAADYDLSLLLDSDAAFNADGTFSVRPLTATSSAELTGLNIERGWPYLANYLTAPVKGTLGLSADAAFNTADGLTIEHGGLSLKGLSARYGVKDGFNLALLQVKDASFHQKENRLVIGDVRLSKGNMSLSRETDGTISLLSLVAKQPASPSSAPVKAVPLSSEKANNKIAAAASKTVKPLTYRLKRFQLDAFNLAFTDKSREDEPHFTLRNTTLSLSNLNGPKFTPAAVRFSSTFGKDALLKASGDITPLPFRYKGSVSVGRLPIRDFEAYFPDTLNFSVIGGNVDTTMNLDIAMKDGKPGGSFNGSAGVRAFHSVDAVDEEDLLKWESLQFDEIKGSLEPFSLSIHEVALNDIYSRIVVRKDGSLNLQNLVEKKEAPAQAAPLPVTAAPETPATAAQKPATALPSAPAQRQISVGSITVQNGTISFTDNHLPQTFNSTFFNLGGRVSGLSSEESKFADVDLRGNLENHSPMQISGRLNPLRDDLFVDLKLSFRDIDLSPITPYSGTYLGYTVDKGKLFLDLKYLIDKKQLNSENKIFIDQFTFGKKVESEKATNLPVRLAVALLKDRKGEIHLDLPVTGRTDDPKLSIWGLIGQVLKNILVKAATSPFALLSSMMGSGQDFSVIQFEVGSGNLPAEEEQKLLQLAKALADRPGLKVEIKGFVDKAKDPEGYRQELLSRKVRNEKFLFLVKEQLNKEGDSAETVQVSADEYSKYLKAVYKKERFPKPRNAIGLVKDLSDNEMKKLIIANTVVGDNELQHLARERSAAVMNYMIIKGGLPPERLFQKNDDIYKAPEKDAISRNRVEFNAIAQ